MTRRPTPVLIAPDQGPLHLMRTLLYICSFTFITGWMCFFISCSLRPEPLGRTRRVEVTAYCPCGQCCGWRRGSARFLYLNFWNKYTRSGAPYTGRTASNDFPREVHPGLLSWDSLQRPYLIPFRVILPWLWRPQDGTIAADTTYYPFGTRVYIPGYGWGTVADRGGAIQGPARMDLFFSSHSEALEWGRRTVTVEIFPPARQD